MTMGPGTVDSAIAERLDRVEAQLAIHDLVARYALHVDARDLDAWCDLFVPDVDCGPAGRGRAALRLVIDEQCAKFYRSIHAICGQSIDRVDADHARGRVMCRAEHEMAAGWVTMMLCYFDRYTRLDGKWYFASRRVRSWYAKLEEGPAGPDFMNWPGRFDLPPPELPSYYASWAEFWGQLPEDETAALTRYP